MQTWHYVWAGILSTVGMGCIVVGIVSETMGKELGLLPASWFLIAIAVSVLSVSSMVTVLYYSRKP